MISQSDYEENLIETSTKGNKGQREQNEQGKTSEAGIMTIMYTVYLKYIASIIHLRRLKEHSVSSRKKGSGGCFGRRRRRISRWSTTVKR